MMIIISIDRIVVAAIIDNRVAGCSMSMVFLALLLAKRISLITFIRRVTISIA